VYCTGHCYNGANSRVDIVGQVQNVPLVVGNKDNSLDKTDWGDHHWLISLEVSYP
jgi:hypothetical protein